MPKQIIPNELAEIVSVLLVKPSLLGELDTLESYHNFVQEIGQVVADFCGGQINGIAPNDPIEEKGVPLLSVSPNDSLPSMSNNVWSYFDLSGWDCPGSLELSYGLPMSLVEINATRKKMQSLLLSEGVAVEKVMRCHLPTSSSTDQPNCDTNTPTANLVFTLDDKASMNVFDDKGDLSVSVTVSLKEAPHVSIAMPSKKAMWFIDQIPNEVFIYPEEDARTMQMKYGGMQQ
jgi:hypothetical protein